ncbi:MAG: SDR family NAD(P)-dependent oxidoreductase [Spirochaetaceae bacterium]
MTSADFYRNRIYWITGASSGIGRALAEEALAAGASVILTARRSEPLAEIAAAAPDRCVVLPADLEEIGAIDELSEAAWNAFGRLDGLFLVAGTSQRAPATETSAEVEARLWNINFRGAARLLKAVVPRLASTNAAPAGPGNNHPGRNNHPAGSRRLAGPRIGVVTSLAAYVPTPLRSTYSASKSALASYAESLAAEIAPLGITLTHVVPGFVRTAVSTSALQGDGSAYGKMDGNQQNGMAPDVCARRILAAVARGRARVFVALGVRGRLALFLSRVFPGLLRRLLSKVASR